VELIPEKDRKFIFYNISQIDAFNIFKNEGINHEFYREIFFKFTIKNI